MDSYILEVFGQSGKCYLVPLNRFPFTIGRGRENDLSLPYSSVSRQHACIEQVGESLIIVDKNSRNHVFVNGRQVQKEGLRKKDMVRIGTVELRLTSAAAPTIPAAAPNLSETLFFPHQDSWDPIHTLSSVFPTERLPRTTRRPPNLQKLLRVSLETGPSQNYENVLDAVEESTHFDRCYLILFEAGSPEEIKILASRFSKNAPQPSSEIFVSREILRRVVKSCEAVVVTQNNVRLRLRDSFIRSGAGTAICLPLVSRGAVTGVLYLDRQSGDEGFSEKDIEILGPVAGIVALKIENLQLLQAYIASERTRVELEIAESVQRDLYPKKPASVPGYSVEGFTRPCFQVGGDYFDFFSHGDSGLTWVLGDVSGKGLSSALYMVSVLSSLRAHLQDDLRLDMLMQRLEYCVRETFRADHFLTLFLARLEAQSGLVTYCNAGHLPPIVVRRNGEVVELTAVDPALNIVPWQDFRCHEYHVDPGDLLFAYTDGLIEAEGKDGEEFGRERMISCILRHRNESLVAIRRELLRELDAFHIDDGLRDDVTLILLRREDT